MKKFNVLFAGESWFYTTTETKGYDQFTIGGYQTEIHRVKEVMDDFANITHIPSHMVLEGFPSTVEELAQYDAVIVSDVGANTFLLHPDTFFHSKTTPNRLHVLADYVNQGGAFGMIGGYMTFMGLEGKGAYAGTVIEEMLPVNLFPHDDRCEHPEGISPSVGNPPHEMVADFPTEWPLLLGYNKLLPKPQAEVVLTHKGDPLLSFMAYGQGKTFAWASDCAPHWLPDEFRLWAYNKVLWKRILEKVVSK